MKMLLKKYNKQFTGVVASLFITPVLFATVYDNSKVASVASKTQQHADQNLFQTQSVFDSGVIGIGAYNDNKRATFAGTFASYLGDQHRHAIALELNGGSDLFRLNATYGVALTDHQRIKLTAERLNQRMDFNYVTGNASHWDGQNALGAEYAYLLENKWVESVGLGGYFSHSGSKDLSDKSFEDANRQKWVEHRRIAGADTFNLHTNTAFHLWSHSRLTAGIDYDSVKFNTKYNDQGKNVRGLGGHAQLEQRILPQLKLMADTHIQSNEHGYGGGIGWLLPTSVPMELQAKTNYTNSLVTHRHYFTSGLHLNVALGNSESHKGYKPEYVDLDGNHAQSLLDWTRTPAVRMSEVVATTDSRLQNVTPKLQQSQSEGSSSEDNDKADGVTSVQQQVDSGESDKDALDKANHEKQKDIDLYAEQKKENQVKSPEISQVPQDQENKSAQQQVDSSESDKDALDKANYEKQKDIDLYAKQEKVHGQGYGYGRTKSK